ncbi:SPOR domain-containing protein, partial [Acinetobacter baumannii]
AMYGRAVSRLSSVIGDRDPTILTSRLRNSGPPAFYQVRFGADTRAEADELCNRIRPAGGACFVLRNRV